MRLRPFARAGLLTFSLVSLLVSVETRAQEKTEAATRQYNSAVGLHNGEAYEMAAKQWQDFINDFPNDPRASRAWHYLGVCYLKQDKLDEAVKTFESVVKDFPGSDLLADTYLNLGLTQYNIAHAGNKAMYDTAAETFNTLATKYPQGKYVADAIFYHGECLYNRDKKKEAAEKYALVVQKHSDRPVAAQATFALGVTQADLGQHQTALQTYDAFLKKHSSHRLATEVTLWKGESLYAMKQYAQAAEAYAAAAAKKGFRLADYATVRQADALSALKKYAEAAALYASVPAKFKNSPYTESCNLEAGKKYYAAGDLVKAQEFLTKVTGGGGKPAPEAAHWLARTLLKENKPVEALAVVEKALAKAEEGPNKVSLLTDQADAVYEIPARRGESVGLYAALAEKYPNDPAAPQALYMAAFAAMNLGDHEAALSHADKFLADHAGHELALGAKHVKAESLLLSNKLAEAEKLYEELLQSAPGDRDAEIWKVHRGTALYLQKKYQEAIDALKPAIGEIRAPELVAEAWYRIGRSQAALKQFDAAAQSLEASLKARAKWKLADDTHLVLAFAYQQLDNLDKAKQNAQKVIAQFPESKLLDVAHYRLAECSRLSGDLKTAVSQYELILKNWPTSVLLLQTLYGLGWAELGLENYAPAEKTFSELVDKHPGDKLVPRARYGRGMARRQLKKFAPAVEDIRAFLATGPSQGDKSRARHVLGLCQRGLNKPGDAVATFRSLLGEDPNYDDKVNVYFELGWALKSAKQDAEAAQTFAKLAKEFPDSPLAADSQYLVGDFHYEKKEYKKAGVAYHVAMTKAGQTKLGEEAAYKLGLCHYLLEDYNSARQSFNYQRATWPNGSLVSDAAFMEGECLLKVKKYQEAVVAYESVKKPSSDDIKVLTLLHASEAAGLLKNWDKSLQLATECANQFPDSPHFPQALYQQGWAQQNLVKLNEALAVYEQVIAKSNREPAARAQFMIGEIQFQQKKFAEAVTSFFKVIYGYGYPELQADATFEAARCFEILKNIRAATKQYQNLIKNFPQSDKVPLAKERLKALNKA